MALPGDPVKKPPMLPDPRLFQPDPVGGLLGGNCSQQAPQATEIGGWIWVRNARS